MKKIYAILLMMLPLAASAQTLSLTVDGETVENGATFTKVYTTDAYDMFPDESNPWHGQYFNYGIYPEVYFTSTVAQNVSFKFTNVSKVEGIQCCFGSTCREVNEGMNYVMELSENVAANTPMDMQIHARTADHSEEAYSREMKLEFNAENGESFTCTLVLAYDPSANAIQSVEAEKRDGRIFGLSGQLQDKLKKGVNIVNGKKILVR